MKKGCSSASDAEIRIDGSIYNILASKSIAVSERCSLRRSPKYIGCHYGYSAIWLASSGHIELSSGNKL